MGGMMWFIVGLLMVLGGIACVGLACGMELPKNKKIRNALIGSTYSAMIGWSILMLIQVLGATGKYNNGHTWWNSYLDEPEIVNICFNNAQMRGATIFYCIVMCCHVGIGWSIYGCMQCCCQNNVIVVQDPGTAQPGVVVVEA